MSGGRGASSSRLALGWRDLANPEARCVPWHESAGVPGVASGAGPSLQPPGRVLRSPRRVGPGTLDPRQLRAREAALRSELPLGRGYRLRHGRLPSAPLGRRRAPLGGGCLGVHAADRRPAVAPRTGPTPATRYPSVGPAPPSRPHYLQWGHLKLHPFVGRPGARLSVLSRQPEPGRSRVWGPSHRHTQRVGGGLVGPALWNGGTLVLADARGPLPPTHPRRSSRSTADARRMALGRGDPSAALASALRPACRRAAGPPWATGDLGPPTRGGRRDGGLDPVPRAPAPAFGARVLVSSFRRQRFSERGLR